jgi:peroxiredoxin
MSSAPQTRRRALLRPLAVLAGAGLITGTGWGLWRSGALSGPGPRRLPAIDYPIIDGRRIGPGQLQGRVTLLNFWATSCAICVAEMPDFVRLYTDYRDRGLEVLAVAMPYDRPDRVLEFARRQALPFPVALDPVGAAVAAWGGVEGTPLTWLVGRDARVRARWLGRIDLARVRRAIEPLLAETPV